MLHKCHHRNMFQQFLGYLVTQRGNEADPTRYPPSWTWGRPHAWRRFYVSHSMNESQTRYQRLKKFVVALFIISKKLKHYFQIFPITILTEYPLRSVIENPKAMGQILKWASELWPYGLRFKLRTTIKEQVLTDFILNFIPWAMEQCHLLEE